MRLRIPLPYLALLGGLACRELPLVCNSAPPTWEVSPSQIDVGIGKRATVQVIQVSCSGRRRELIYPQLIVADTSIAFAVNAERYVQGRAPGSTLLTLVADNGYGPAEIPVIVR